MNILNLRELPIPKDAARSNSEDKISISLDSIQFPSIRVSPQKIRIERNWDRIEIESNGNG